MLLNPFLFHFYNDIVYLFSFILLPFLFFLIIPVSFSWDFASLLLVFPSNRWLLHFFLKILGLTLVYNFHTLSQNNTFWVQLLYLFKNSSSFFQLLIFVLMLSLLLSLLPFMKWLTFFRRTPWNVCKVGHQDHLSGDKIKLHSFGL